MGLVCKVKAHKLQAKAMPESYKARGRLKRSRVHACLLSSTEEEEEEEVTEQWGGNHAVTRWG